MIISVDVGSIIIEQEVIIHRILESILSITGNWQGITSKVNHGRSVKVLNDV